MSTKKNSIKNQEKEVITSTPDTITLTRNGDVWECVELKFSTKHKTDKEPKKGKEKPNEFISIEKLNINGRKFITLSQEELHQGYVELTDERVQGITRTSSSNSEIKELKEQIKTEKIRLGLIQPKVSKSKIDKVTQLRKELEELQSK